MAEVVDHLVAADDLVETEAQLHRRMLVQAVLHLEAEVAAVQLVQAGAEEDCSPQSSKLWCADL